MFSLDGEGDRGFCRATCAAEEKNGDDADIADRAGDNNGVALSCLLSNPSAGILGHVVDERSSDRAGDVALVDGLDCSCCPFA